MTPEQQATIMKVIDRIAPKYTFGFYDVNDIKQEAFLICMEAMERYDPTRPLENFISKHLANRLKSFIRDKYFRQSSPNLDKKMLADLQISISDIVPPEYVQDIESKLSTADALDKVMQHLPPSYRNDFLRVANGVTIQSHRKNNLFAKVLEILNEDW